MFPPPQPLQLLRDPLPRPLGLFRIDFRGNDLLPLHLNLKPAPLPRPFGQRLARNDHLPVFFADKQDGLLTFETINDCFFDHYCTVKGIDWVACWPLRVAVTTMVQVPLLVFVPTFQAQFTVPSALAVLGPRPWAVLAPDL